MDIANYADNNTPYVTADDMDEVVLLKWFSDNLVKDNADKYHLPVNVKIELV